MPEYKDVKYNFYFVFLFSLLFFHFFKHLAAKIMFYIGSILYFVSMLALVVHANSTQTTAPMRQMINVGSMDVSWADMGDYVNFKLSVLMPINMDIYAAIGFSLDQEMSNDDVCACKMSQLLVGVEHMFNSDVDQVYVNNTLKSIGFSNQYIQILDQENGPKKLVCTFDRIKEMPSQKNYFSLKERPYYLLTSHGLTKPTGVMLYHGPINRASSAFMIDFDQAGKSLATTTPPIISPSLSFFSRLRASFINMFKWFKHIFN